MDRDIFDRIMALPGLRIFEPFYKKNKEMLLYLFFGFLSFVVNVILYGLFYEIFHINELIANIFSWIITVVFAFFTNRIWVFESSTDSFKAFMKQMIAFYQGRLVTLVIEEIILFVFITVLAMNSIVVKIAAQVIVIVLNYVFSKLFVFK